MNSDFNLPKFVQEAFKKLQSDVELTADVTIGKLFDQKYLLC